MFFLVMGSGAFLLFVVSDLADQADFDFLFISLVLIGIGWSMWRKKTRPASAGRFAVMRKWRENNRGKREERSKNKNEANKK